ncbi:hypothetical protein AVEN_261785-1 [Araneus ventricosus]|uniref:Uncharacterized protein n=1 Tax=Araneus ventricosus TaxID=182803 RepID=A0A4Y2LZ10_ARAVE|nr:hypothetical protein AVEN_261785-1 [Araneus ventricosus]
MNFPRYLKLYSRFHGCTSYRHEQNIIILDFVDMPFDPWAILHFYRYDVLRMDAQQPFVQALKVFHKTEAPITIACLNDSWTALLGNFKTVMPMTEESATFQLYATPYFVKDPSLVTEYLEGISRVADDHIFLYKNCVLYLDKNDLPYPGGCYFRPTGESSQNSYRICILSNEPVHHVLTVASEWKTRRDVTTQSFLTKEVIVRPKIIPFQPVGQLFLPDERAVSAGMIQKRLSVHKPYCLIQDVINSYYRSYLHAHDGQESMHVLQNLGLLIEWPFRIAFEGTRPVTQDNRAFVALVVNGQRPSRFLYVRYPYEVYTEFNEVPSTFWTPIFYVSKVLTLPKDMEKVSVDSVNLGYMYQNAFFCFNHPVVEGRPTFEGSRNVKCLLSPCAPVVLTQSNVRVLESFQLNSQHSLHRVQMTGVPFSAWCVSQESSEFPTQRHLQRLVQEWIDLFEKHIGFAKEDMLDVTIIQMALTLARHKICFQTKIDPKAKRKQRGNRILLSDKEIELSMGSQEAEFVNSIRVTATDEPTTKRGWCEVS